MKAQIKNIFTKVTNQRVYPATSQHANIGKSINRVKTEDILFDFETPPWLMDEHYNMIIHFDGRLFMVHSDDFDYVWPNIKVIWYYHQVMNKLDKEILSVIIFLSIGEIIIGGLITFVIMMWL